MEKEKEPQYCVNCKHYIVNNNIYYCQINSIKNYIRKKDIYRTCNEIRGSLCNSYCKYYEPKQNWFKRLFKNII